MSTTYAIPLAEVLRRTGATYRQADYWCRNGILRPELSGGGSGSVRRWNEDDVRVLSVLSRVHILGSGLTSDYRGLRRSAMTSVARLIYGWDDEPWLVIDADGEAALVHYLDPARLADGALVLRLH